MSTRGVIIFRKGGVEKGVYNHWDSYPSGLGEDIVETIKKEVDLEKVFGLMQSGSHDQENFSLSSLAYYAEKGETIVYEEYKHFILDSLMCEHGYVFDLDKQRLEYRVGWQYEPDPSNRYGTEPGFVSHTGKKYYPCKLVGLYPFAGIRRCSTDEVVKAMEEERSFFVADDRLSVGDLVADLVNIQNEAVTCLAALSSDAKESFCLDGHLATIAKSLENLRQQTSLEHVA